MNKFYLVWNPAKGVPFKRHPTRGSAMKEAERLAASNWGSEFFVLEAKSVSKRTDVTTTSLEDNEPDDCGLPF